MTNPQQDHGGDRHAHYRAALDHARRLSEVRPDRAFVAAWSAQSAHVGDLSVLILALQD